jgi:glycosyltransferase involved in cell wall biosynthesis
MMKPLRVLMLHNYYQQPGGEDECFHAEVAMLNRRGHEVIPYCLHNDAVADYRPTELAAATIWNRRSYAEVMRLIVREAPDIMHCHNTFPLISPAVYYAAQRSGIPVVQTLHNYRPLCLGGIFFRDGAPCEECLGKRLPWPGVRHGCYRGGHLVSLAVAAMLSVHRGLETWTRQVDLFLAVSQFVRRKFIENGFPARQLQVKPNFLMNDPGVGSGRGGYAVVVGRLSPEKGLLTLLRAWGMTTALPLKIVGDGPLMSLKDSVGPDQPIEFLGRRPPEEIFGLIQDAQFLVAPSECYETFGRAVIEAFACGTPVIAADIGAFSELVDHGRTGLKFTPGDAADLRDKVAALQASGPRLQEMRRAARREFIEKYSEEANYCQLIGSYTGLMQASRVPADAAAS